LIKTKKEEQRDIAMQVAKKKKLEGEFPTFLLKARKEKRMGKKWDKG